MALRALKKDVKKSSYYVWFLGAQEASGSAPSVALSALARLERRSKDLAEPFKVTLQLSQRGLKIVQNKDRKGSGKAVKHFLPAESVTEARTRGDAVVCLLLLYNPVTRCPLHAHAYRCDSEQTAQALCAHLRAVAGLGPETDEPEEPYPQVAPEEAIPRPRYDSEPRGEPTPRPRYDPELPNGDPAIRARYELDHPNDPAVRARYEHDHPNESMPRSRYEVDHSNDPAVRARYELDHANEQVPRSRYDIDHQNDPAVRARYEMDHQNELAIRSRYEVDQRSDPNARARYELEHHARAKYDLEHRTEHTTRAKYDFENRNEQRHETRLAPEQELAAERLAAELRRRLAGREPLLLPPRDYDAPRRTPQVSAQTNVGPRRAAGSGPTAARPVVGSSAGSSGIGSDLAPSPDRPHTSSEEDWGDSTAYMLHEGFDVSVSPTRRAHSPPSGKIPARGKNRHSAGSVSPKDRFNVAKEKFMNLEREKLNEEIEQRAQIRRNLNAALTRGPISPTELKSNHRSKWDDDEDIIVERRPEMPRAVIRNDPRDVPRNSREAVRDERDPRITREHRESRNVRDSREYKESRDPMDMREFRDVKPLRDARDYREYRESRDYKDSKEIKDGKRDPRYSRDQKKIKDNREIREYKEPRDVKYLREYRDVSETRDPRTPEDPRDSRERTPHFEQRYFEYRGERNDKYFDNRYNKHDPRSDDEGVESEKQFEEIRYVPHVEAPKRREQEPRVGKVEPVPRKEPARDGRIELLEERQRQMESKRVGRPVVVDERYDRSLEMQRRPQAESRDWEVLRRSYAEAERPRRDARARHSYAEPVARTRVGMATVAPF